MSATTDRAALANALDASPAALDDLELVQQTKEGDAEAFSELVRRHQSLVYNLAYRFMREANAAEDMAQEAFLKAFRLIKGFRGDSSFSTWMYRVTSSVCLNELQRIKKRGESPLIQEHLEGQITRPSEISDVAEHVRGCVAKLPERHRGIVTLYYLKGLAYEEIAERLNIPLGTLKTWMFRARKQLRAIVEKELPRDAW